MPGLDSPITDLDLPLETIELRSSDPVSPRLYEKWIRRYAPPEGYPPMSCIVGDNHDQPILIDLDPVNDYAFSLFRNTYDPNNSYYLFAIAPDGSYAAALELGAGEFQFYPVGADVSGGLYDQGGEAANSILIYGEGTTYQQMADYLNALDGISEEPWVSLTGGVGNDEMPDLEAFQENPSMGSVRADSPYSLTETMTLKIQGRTGKFSFAGTLE